MDVTLTHLLLVVGLVGVTPLCLALNPCVRPAVVRVAVVVGVAAALGLLLPPGPVALAIVGAWQVLAIGVAAAGVRPALLAWRSTEADAASALAPLAALVFWVVGAMWLLLDRAELDPVGVGEEIVLLTAVHFHFAGLAATTIVWRTARRRGGRVLGAALIGVLAAPPIVALGFVAVPALQVLGAVVFTVALLAWSWRAGQMPGIARRPWMLARGSVWLAMPLATWWAVGHVTGLPAPTISGMAATHGMANAVGFSLCGAAALVVAEQRRASPAVPSHVDRG